MLRVTPRVLGGSSQNVLVLPCLLEPQYRALIMFLLFPMKGCCCLLVYVGILIGAGVFDCISPASDLGSPCVPGLWGGFLSIPSLLPVASKLYHVSVVGLM